MKAKKKAWKAKPKRDNLKRLASKIARKRDGNKCFMCGETNGTMHAHHIFHDGAYPNTRFYLPNLVTLCPAHHLKLHTCGEATFIAGVIEHYGEEWYMELSKIANAPVRPWGPTEYERDYKYLSDKAVELGLEEILD